MWSLQGNRAQRRVMETPYEHQCNYIGDDGKEHSTSPSTLCFACGYEAALQLRPRLEREWVIKAIIHTPLSPVGHVLLRGGAERIADAIMEAYNEFA